MGTQNKIAPDLIEKAVADEADHMAFVGVLKWALALHGEMARANNGYVSSVATEELVAAAWRVFNEMAGAELDIVPIAAALNGWQS